MVFPELLRRNMMDQFPVTFKTFEMMVNSSNEPTFLYRVQDGLHLKSWGSHCAKLAGIPDAIIRRSEEIGELLDQHKFIAPLTDELSEKKAAEEDAIIDQFLKMDDLSSPQCLSTLLFPASTLT
jgi:DNA mismatch repair ATPase MutS